VTPLSGIRRGPGLPTTVNRDGQVIQRTLMHLGVRRPDPVRSPAL
jgi:hypothetical protein